MTAFIGILIACIIVIKNNPQETAVVVGAFGSILITVVALPKIIAENLFPKHDNDKSIELIKEVFSGDIGIRKHHQDGVRNRE